MCQKCVKKAKNLGRPKTVKPGLIRAMVAGQSRQKYPCFPLFYEMAANFAIEALMYQNLRSKTNKKIYTRKTRHNELY